MEKVTLKLRSFYCSVILIMYQLFLISITKNIVDGHLALPWRKIDIHVVRLSISGYLGILVRGLGSQLVLQVHGLLEVVGGATLETLTAGGDKDGDGVMVAVRAEDSHHH